MRITVDLTPGLNSDDTSYGATGTWRSSSLVRFRLGRPQTEGGWESLMSDTVTGVCRAVFPWTDNAGVLNIGFGTHSNLQVWYGGELFDITPYGAPVRLSEDPLSVTNGSATVTVTHAAHGYTTGDSLKIHGATDTGGITAANLNGTRTIIVTGADAYTFTAGASASSTATGGGADVVVTPQTVLPAGAIDGTGSAGYGTGAYGSGPYGQTTAEAEYFPRTWSLQAWGEQLLASPRGGGLYLWENDTAARAEAVDNAPTRITHMVVAPMSGGYQAFALGCEEESSGEFNPLCIRHSSIRRLDEWSTLASGSTAGEYILTGGGRIVAGGMCGPYLLVWTSDALFLGTFVGALNQPWRFDRVGRNCGLIGPKAFVIVGQAAFWVSPDKQVFTYALGGQPKPVPCPILEDFADNLAASQGDKIVASSNSTFSEVRWEYPDSRDGYENSRYFRVVIDGPDAGAWSNGQLARTAMVDAAPQPYPIGVDYDGHAYYHEKGNSADGEPMTCIIRSAAQAMDPNWRLLIREVWPDFKGANSAIQTGPVNLTIYAKERPQGDETSQTVTLAPGQGRADVWISGSYFEFEIASQSAPTDWRLGRLTFDVVRDGPTL